MEMQGTSKHAMRYNQQGDTRLSIYNQSDPLDKQIRGDQHKRLTSASTFIHNARSQNSIQRKAGKQVTEFFSPDEGSKQAATSKWGENRSRVQSSEKSGEQFNSHLIKLKIEEMVFKFKSRIGSLLKEMAIPLPQLGKFATLAKIDDILNFLSDRVRERLLLSELSQNSVAQTRTKEKELLTQYQAMIESLRKRVIQKETLQRQQKQKLKQNHAQLRELYDKINLKEKDLSLKVTQLYQTRIMLRQSEKLVEGVQNKAIALQKERNELRQSLQNSGKNLSSTQRLQQEENQQLKQTVSQLKEQLQMASQKEGKLQQLNNQLSQEVARWRERFQQEREKTPDQVEIAKEYLSYSQNSIENRDISPFLLKIDQLQRETKILRIDISSLQLENKKYKQQYQIQKRRAEKFKAPDPKNDLQNDKQVADASTQRKLQQIATQWKTKLVQLVNSYSAEQDRLKDQISHLQQQNKALQKKIFTLANDKYISECKAIQKQAQINEFIRKSKGKVKLALPTQEVASEQEMLISNTEIEPRPKQLLSQSARMQNRKDYNLLQNL